MIDLHMHTNYSDGTDTVETLLSSANKINLKTISITDHDTCLAYEQMKKIDVTKLYQGNIIVGCEFTTSYHGIIIEVLGYGFDYQKISKFLNKYYTNEFKMKSRQILHKRLINKIKTLNLICNIEKVENMESNSKSFIRDVYKELSSFHQNKDILKEDIFSSLSDFYRKGIYNPESRLFLNYPEFKPSLREIIDLVHSCGGITFLAHPYQYNFSDMELFLNNIYNEYNLDGIECFYTTFNEEHTNYLLNFAKARKLLISGGSDYHGTNKIQHELGIGKRNLNINEDIISNWKINYYLKRRY